jgi:phosphoribosyl-ATP pyrophosphohydrolase
LTAPKPAEETVNILNVKSENYASAATVPIDSNQENAFIDNLNAKAHEANQKLGAQSAEPIIAVDKRQAQTLIDNLNAKVHEANRKLGAQSAEPIIAVDKRQAQTLIDNLNAKVHEANQKLGAQSAEPIIAVDKRQAQTLIDNLNAKVHEANQKLGAQSAEPIIAVDATPKNKVDLPKFLNAIPPDYSGYLIELISTIRPILDSRFFGNYTPIYIDFINGKYAHLIGRFNTEKEAETYLNKMVLTKFPFAKAIKYVNGKQTN